MDKLRTIIEEITKIGIPCAYDHFAEGEAPNPPFAVYLTPGSDNFLADGQVYLRVDQVHLEIYTDRKDPDMEERIMDILDANGMPYEYSEVWIESEKLYEVLFIFECGR